VLIVTFVLGTLIDLRFSKTSSFVDSSIASLTNSLIASLETETSLISVAKFATTSSSVRLFTPVSSDSEQLVIVTRAKKTLNIIVINL